MLCILLSNITNSYPVCFPNNLDLRKREMGDKCAVEYHVLAVLLLLCLERIVVYAFPHNTCGSVFILRKNKVKDVPSL